MLQRRVKDPEKENRERKRALDAAVSSLSSLSREEAAEMRDANLLRWHCSMVKISGSLLSKQRIRAMLAGETVREATVEEYRYLRACTALYKEFRHMADFSIALDEKYIIRIYEILSGKKFSGYRRSDCVLKGIGYRPPAHGEIRSLMKAADREISSQEHGEDPIEGAIRTHDMIFAVWPFEEKNGDVAYAAMSYELFLAGYPLPALDIDDVEHLAFLGEFVGSGRSDRFCGAVIQSRLDQCGNIRLGLG